MAGQAGADTRAMPAYTTTGGAPAQSLQYFASSTPQRASPVASQLQVAGVASWEGQRLGGVLQPSMKNMTFSAEPPALETGTNNLTVLAGHLEFIMNYFAERGQSLSLADALQVACELKAQEVAEGAQKAAQQYMLPPNMGVAGSINSHEPRSILEQRSLLEAQAVAQAQAAQQQLSTPNTSSISDMGFGPQVNALTPAPPNLMVPPLSAMPVSSSTSSNTVGLQNFASPPVNTQQKLLGVGAPASDPEVGTGSAMLAHMRLSPRAMHSSQRLPPRVASPSPQDQAVLQSMLGAAAGGVIPCSPAVSLPLMRVSGPQPFESSSAFGTQSLLAPASGIIGGGPPQALAHVGGGGVGVAVQEGPSYPSGKQSHWQGALVGLSQQQLMEGQAQAQAQAQAGAGQMFRRMGSVHSESPREFGLNPPAPQMLQGGPADPASPALLFGNVPSLASRQGQGAAAVFGAARTDVSSAAALFEGPEDSAQRSLHAQNQPSLALPLSSRSLLRSPSLPARSPSPAVPAASTLSGTAPGVQVTLGQESLWQGVVGPAAEKNTAVWRQHVFNTLPPVKSAGSGPMECDSTAGVPTPKGSAAAEGGSKPSTIVKRCISLPSLVSLRLASERRECASPMVRGAAAREDSAAECFSRKVTLRGEGGGDSIQKTGAAEAVGRRERKDEVGVFGDDGIVTVPVPLPEPELPFESGSPMSTLVLSGMEMELDTGATVEHNMAPSPGQCGALVYSSGGKEGLKAVDAATGSGWAKVAEVGHGEVLLVKGLAQAEGALGTVVKEKESSKDEKMVATESVVDAISGETSWSSGGSSVENLGKRQRDGVDGNHMLETRRQKSSSGTTLAHDAPPLDASARAPSFAGDDQTSGPMASADCPELPASLKPSDESAELAGGHPMYAEYPIQTSPARRLQLASAQNAAARARRERIRDRMKALQMLVPSTNTDAKLDTATMLQETIEYVKFLQEQVKMLSLQPSPENKASSGTGMAPTSSQSADDAHASASATAVHRSPPEGLRPLPLPSARASEPSLPPLPSPRPPLPPTPTQQPNSTGGGISASSAAATLTPTSRSSSSPVPPALASPSTAVVVIVKQEVGTHVGARAHDAAKNPVLSMTTSTSILDESCKGSAVESLATASVSGKAAAGHSGSVPADDLGSSPRPSAAAAIQAASAPAMETLGRVATSDSVAKAPALASWKG